MVDVTYFKCTNGFKTPSGFEWMKPTKVYFVFGNDTDNANNYLNTITYNPWNIGNGDNLTEINNIYNQQVGGNSMFLGNNSNIPLFDYGVETFSLCMDCGLGYWATVQLLDDFIPGRDSRITTGSVGFPTQGFGYTCGQPTAEDALKIAWESARKMLGKTPKAFNYEIGINAKPQELTISDKYRSSGSSLQYQTDYERPDKNFGYATVPDNVNDFIILVKQNKKYYFSDYDKRDNHPMYGCSFNEGKEKNGSLINYPIFTEKIGGSSKQSVNINKKKEVVKEKVVENSNLNNSQSTINYHSFGKELTKNFGKIENGKTLIHSFRLSKKIKSANASCGCITVETNQNVPTVVMATFHGIANDYKGPFVKSIAVIYEDGTTETLYLKGELQ